MPLLYDLGTGLYHAGIRLAAPFKPKARQWVDGRNGLWDRLEAKREALHGCLWMHCASVGEFEQGRPVLEAIRKERPDLPVLLTFFSPSGYEARKDFPLATHVDYLPPDSAHNAKRLVGMVKPRMALFIKYEFWYHHLHALKAANVPTFLVSGIFREGQPFFKWYGGAWKRMLRCYTHVFTQDERSRELLERTGLPNVTMSGDTRFDRVAAIAAANEDLSPAQAFKSASQAPVLICGSTWPADETLVLDALRDLKHKPRIIIAPHELTRAHLDAAEAAFPKSLITWTEAEAAPNIQTSELSNLQTLLVDQMGLLARLYRYGDVAYVGGGFTDGIHSILEAAAWDRPVFFGPKHTKFAEAQGLIDAGGGFCVRNADEMREVLERLFGNAIMLKAAGEAAGRYVRKRTGATGVVCKRVLAHL